MTAQASDVARSPLEVAVGILIDSSGQFLLTTRPQGKVYAGFWEFPGGKLEGLESVEAALRRELHEELGVHILASRLWKTTQHEYAHALVNLHWCKVFAWTGELQMREGQQFAWQRFPISVAPVLPGSVAVLQALFEEGVEA